jgi:hypothetical protein
LSIIADKFKYNSWGNRQLREKAFIDIWQASKSINEVEERYEALQEAHFAEVREIRTYEKYLELMAQKKLFVYTVDTNGSSKTHEYQAAKRFIKDYEPYPDGYRMWYRANYRFSPTTSLMTTARRLRKNGVSKLRKLKRHSPDYADHYAELNQYAASLL